MDWQYAFNVAFLVAGAAIGWVVKIIYDTQERLRTDFMTLDKQLPETYVRRDDFSDFVRRIEDGINRILDKMDQKADKQ